MSNVVDKKKKNIFSKDLFILSIATNGKVNGSFKMEGFGLPDFRASWDNFIEGYTKATYGKEFVEEAVYNTDSVDIPVDTNIEAGFETVVGDDTIRGYYTPFFSIGI